MQAAHSGLAQSLSHGATYALFREEHNTPRDNKSRSRKMSRHLSNNFPANTLSNFVIIAVQYDMLHCNLVREL
jgi:hypothetical protein